MILSIRMEKAIDISFMKSGFTKTTKKKSTFQKTKFI